MAQLRLTLFLCITVTVTSLLLIIQVEAEKAQGGGRSELSNIQGQLNSVLELRGEIGKSGASSVEPDELHRWQEVIWLRRLQKFSDRVFHVAGEEEQAWPELKLGWRTGWAVILGGLGAALSSAGGLGGGGLFVPLFNLLLQFDAKTSAALSNFMILGGSLANLYLNLRQRHPRFPGKPLIDFDLLVLLQPNLLLGISIGVILNVVLPDWVITAALTFTLTIMTVHSFNGARRRWDKETRLNFHRESSRNISGGFAKTVLAPDRQSGDITGRGGFSGFQRDSEEGLGSSALHESEHVDDETEEEALATFHGDPLLHQLPSSKKQSQSNLSEPLLPDGENSDAYAFPTGELRTLGLTWFAFFAIQVLRGGKGSKGILPFPACGWAYWLLTFLQIPLALWITYSSIKRFSETHPSNLNSKTTVIQEEGFVLKPESCKRFAYMALTVGISGGLLGIGGGMIINPMLLAIGMIPQVTAGTCAAIVFFSSSMSVVQFWLMGRVPVEYALSAALVSAISSFVGVLLIQRAIAKYNRASLIVFSVAIVMGLSAILMAGFGGLGVWEKYQSGGYMGFHRPC